MKQWCFRALAAASIAAAVGCGSSSPTTPTPGSATVTSVIVTGAAAAGANFQLTASAHLSDGTTRDVTALALWESSNTALALVSSIGVVSVMAAGQVDFRATYQSVSGSLRLLVSPAPAPTKLALTGVVREAAPNVHAVAGARVMITDGPDAGAVSVSDEEGLYTFPALTAGVIGVEASKDGFVVWRVMNFTISRNMGGLDIALFPIPPKDASGNTATARCNDGSWSWAATRGDACPTNGGIAYTVCPGALCVS
jgi:hypothetical protein